MEHLCTGSKPTVFLSMALCSSPSLVSVSSRQIVMECLQRILRRVVTRQEKCWSSLEVWIMAQGRYRATYRVFQPPESGLTKGMKHNYCPLCAPQYYNCEKSGSVQSVWIRTRLIGAIIPDRSCKKKEKKKIHRQSKGSKMKEIIMSGDLS